MPKKYWNGVILMAYHATFHVIDTWEKMWKNMIKKFFQSQKGGDFWNLWEKEMRLYVLYLIWKYPTLTSLTLLLMRKNLTGAWFKVGASKNLSVLSQKEKIRYWTLHIERLNGVDVSQRKVIPKVDWKISWL